MSLICVQSAGFLLLFVLPCAVAAASLELVIDTAHPVGEIDLTRYALGQGGLSDKPMFDSHVEQLAQLHPQTIRIFVQEFFDLYPERGRYHWKSLDQMIETILATKAKPILSLCFKPKLLFPKIDQQVVHPTDYKEWEELIFQLVKHCNEEKRYGVEYWEVSNEPDIGEDGGCPYLFQAPDYVTYYTHTVNAIRRADPKAKVGGPALAGYNSDIGTELIEHCGKGDTPLHFFAWHVYHSDPTYFRKSIRDVKAKLGKFPKLKEIETIIDEWNMSLDEPVLTPEFQPAFVLETTRGFYEEGLTRSAYYHIRDSFVDEQQFAKFMSKSGAAFVARWWNDMPQYDGLYDNQGRVRPTYYVFKLLSLMKGQELAIAGANSSVKGFAVKNSDGTHVLLWNFPLEGRRATQEVTVRFPSNKSGVFRIMRLNPEAHFNQLELQARGSVTDLEAKPIRLTMAPYEIRWVMIAP